MSGVSMSLCSPLSLQVFFLAFTASLLGPDSFRWTLKLLSTETSSSSASTPCSSSCFQQIQSLELFQVAAKIGCGRQPD